MRLSIHLLSLLTFLLIACGPDSKRQQGGHTVYTPHWAQGFRIDSVSGGLLITVNNPWQGAKGVERSLLISSPPRRIIAMSSTHVALLDAIGGLDRVVGVSGRGFVSNPRLSALDVGYEGNVDYERLVALKPDLVLLYSTNSASTMEAKLTELNIPFLYVGDYLEQSPLGKAEWMMALAHLIGNPSRGEAVMSAIAHRYTALKDSIAALGVRHPKVMLNMPYSGAWFMPSRGSYAITLITDAGGSPVYKEDTGNESTTIGMEQAFLLASEADIWLNPGTISTLSQLTEALPRFAKVKAVAHGAVWNNNKRSTSAGGNDYYESGIVHPDEVLSDLINIFHNGGRGVMKYYKKIE